MRPVLFELGSIKVHSFGVMIVLGLLAALWFGRKRAARFGFSDNDLADVTIWALLLGVLGARLAFVAQEWSYYKDHLGEILTKFEGLTSFGGLIFGFLGILLWRAKARKPLWRLLDLLAPSFLLAHAIGRIGCLLNGCCYGGQCSLPWAIRVHDQAPNLLFHPAQIYDGIMNVGAIFLVLQAEKRGLRSGQGFGIMLVLHGLARFIYEFWRAGTTSTYMGRLPITDAQAAALLLMAIGGILIFVRKNSIEQAAAA